MKHRWLWSGQSLLHSFLPLFCNRLRLFTVISYFFCRKPGSLYSGWSGDDHHIIAEEYHAGNAILFGPYARKEADRQSDIDLLVIGGPLFDLTDIFPWRMTFIAQQVKALMYMNCARSISKASSIRPF